MRQPVDLAHASRLVNHGPTVLVTTEHAGRRNVMAAAWSMPVEFTPPRIAVVVVIDEPSGKDYFGGKVAGPVFARVVSDTLRYLGVPGSTPPNAKPLDGKAHEVEEVVAVLPIDDEPLPPSDLPDFRGMSVGRALEAARAAGVTIEVVGSGRAVAQEPGAGATVRVTFADSPGKSQ